MLRIATLLCIAWLSAVQGKPNQARTPQLPSYGNSYYAAGYIELPYAEIKEEFEGYVDKINNKSRIDYYNGMDKTFQRGDIGPYGANYKIVPSKFENSNSSTITCFLANGTANSTVEFQDIIPDLTGYTYQGQETIESKLCDIWSYKYAAGSRTNENTFWVDSSDQTPVKFHMIGYDSLLGSHFDRYYITYTVFNNKAVPPATMFEVPNNSTCTGFPGPGAQNKLSFNPMAEFIHNDDSHLDPMFKDFVDTHNKSFTKDEHVMRKEIFRQNVRYIHSTNRAGKSYKVKLNKFADRTDDELKVLRGSKKSVGVITNAKTFNKYKYNLKDLPASIDWRIAGAVSPVKDQGICGSCWSFGTTGTLEGTYFLKTGNRIILSEQNLIDCSWGFGNNGCDGGEDFRAYEYILKHGIIPTDLYGPYLAQDGYCNSRQVNTSIPITGYVNITPYDTEALKAALVNHGPISISIDASHKSLSFYDHGVYYEPTCGNTPDALDHSVLLVGYGTFDKQDYWLVKNSWSYYWGNDGYVLMAIKDNNCGVQTAPTFAEM